MSTGSVGPTRARDLLAIAALAALAGYALTRFNYQALPRLPRFAGLTAVLLGVGEAVAGFGLRRRIRARSDAADRARRHSQGERDRYGEPFQPGAVAAAAALPAPVPPLTAARALAVAKASALAGSALAGLWIGFGVYVLPDASRAAAPAADSVTAVIGLVSAIALIAGALWLEYCCRVRGDGAPRRD